jgi:hypothetical protein
LISPQLDAPFKNARWELFLPADYEYHDAGGTMTREAASTPQVASFSFLDYNSREQMNRTQLRRGVTTDLKVAREELSRGNVKEAVGNFYRARGKGDVLRDEEFKKVEEELRRVQSSNLINAQNLFTFNNNGTFAIGGNEGDGVVGNRNPVQYDNAAAEAQWTKLQQAQEVGVARVRPLRVNLPTRGLRHAFTQVLQVEVARPMIIQLVATSTRSVGWPRRAVFAAFAFLLLWGAVAGVTRLAQRRTT